MRGATGRRVRTLAVLFVLGAVGVGCSRDERREGAAHAVDALAAAAVRARLAAVSPDAASEVRIRVADGAVVLGGRVRRGEVVAPLIAAARDVPGVRSVRSEIAVDPTVPSLGAKAADLGLAARVRGALLREAGLNAFDVTIGARGGAITLGGRAKTREIASTVVAGARAVTGVRAVIDRIRVGR